MAATSVVPGPLVERDRELAQIEEAVDELRASAGAVVVVEGAPGTGKTRLLGALEAAAARAELPIAAARAVDLDAAVPLAVARRLLERPLRAAGGERERRAPAALETAATGSSAPLAEGALAAASAVISGIEALVDSGGPLVAIVDDAQWADALSLQLLGHLADRARELPVLLGAAVRPGELEPKRLARLLRRGRRRGAAAGGAERGGGGRIPLPRRIRGGRRRLPPRLRREPLPAARALGGPRRGDRARGPAGGRPDRATRSTDGNRRSPRPSRSPAAGRSRAGASAGRARRRDPAPARGRAGGARAGGGGALGRRPPRRGRARRGRAPRLPGTR